ncbi:MAG: toll/interleukin-1 receptor domain-containing protein [Oscillospiraceae bacterium]|nr:toll/interleukin-1 receptor domain-containing protein [Oscillospiraceae bacterium]
MNKPVVFFSHSSKDSSMVSALKNRLNDITGGVLDIFQSSDGQSIPFGRNWVHKIEEGLANATVMFVFVTPNSISSNWIYFEAGFAYSNSGNIISLSW